MSLFFDQAPRLLREKWGSVQELAEELFAMFTSKVPLVSDVPIRFTALPDGVPQISVARAVDDPTPAITVTRGDDPGTVISLGGLNFNPDGTITASGGSFPTGGIDAETYFSQGPGGTTIPYSPYPIYPPGGPGETEPPDDGGPEYTGPLEDPPENTEIDGGVSPPPPPPPPGAIAFVRKDQFGDFNLPTGEFEWEMTTQPDGDNTIVLIVYAAGNQGFTDGVPPEFDTPTNGDGDPYTQVGGGAYQAGYTYDSVGFDEVYYVKVFTLKCTGSIDDKTVKVNITDTGEITGANSAVIQLVALEFANVAAGGSTVTDFVKAELSGGNGGLGGDGTRPLTLPDIDLNNTTGQAVVYVIVHHAGTDLLPSTGYTPHYGHSGDPFLDFAIFAVASRVGLAGFGPEEISVNWSGGSPTEDWYCGIGIALQKG